MDNLRAAIENDLGESLEAEWGMPVELTSPDGQTQRYSLLNPSELLKGQIFYFTRSVDPATGETIIVNQPVVNLRIASLIRKPEPGETWHIRCQTSPRPGSPFQDFVFTPDRSTMDGTDIGFIRIYPQRIESNDDVS
jgi:hypothetical protein